MNKFFTIRESCPCCKTTNSNTLIELGYAESPIKEYLDTWYSYGKMDKEYLNGSNYILKECQECGLVYQNEILNEYSTVKLYNQWIDYEKVIDRVDSNRNIRYYITLVKDLINAMLYLNKLPSELNLLDFGMGFGTWCHLAKGLGCNVYGTEISQTRSDYAKDIKIINWAEIPNYRFDFINIDQVLEHLAEPLETLVYLKKALKPDGLIKIGVPNGWDVKKKLSMWDWETLKGSVNSCNSLEKIQLIKKIWDWEAPAGNGNEYSINSVAPLQHINCFNHDVLVKMAERVGLGPVDVSDKFTTVTHLSLQHRIKKRARTLLKPYYYALTRRKETVKKSTKLFFQNFP